MYNEKQNKANWIKMLDEPCWLPPGELIDKNDAWGKLHERLSRKPHKNKMIWYWAAAACLLIAFAFYIFTSKMREDLLVKRIPASHKNEPAKIVNASPTTSKVTLAIKNDLAVNKKEHNTFITKPVNYIRPEKGIAANQILIPVVENTNATKQQVTIILDQAIDTISPIIAVAAPVKKKMQVVHINELEKAQEGMALTSPNRPQNNFNLAIGNNKQSISQTSIAGDYAGIFKIKISSKN